MQGHTPPVRDRETRWIYSMVAVLLLLTLAVALWHDLLRDRERRLQDASLLVGQKAQFLTHSFGETFQAAEYLLRDVLGHVDVSRDLAADGGNVRSELLSVLQSKMASVAALEDLVLIDSQCRYVALAYRPQLRGKRSDLDFCSTEQTRPGPQMHLRYLPAGRSASGRPVLLVARTVSSFQGQLLGGAVAVVDLSYVKTWFSRIQQQPHDMLGMLDQEGHWLAVAPQAETQVGGVDLRLPGQPSFNQLLSDQLATGSIVTDGVTPWDGRRRLSGFATSGPLGVVGVVGMDVDSVLAQWRERVWEVLLGYLALCVVTGWALVSHLRARRDRLVLEVMATTDALSGLANRRHWAVTLDAAFASAKRYRRPLSLLMLDIDHFKGINDSHGHAVGDRVIQAVARHVQEGIRLTDTAGRLGGEEFAVILPDTELDGAKVLAERLRETIAQDHGVHNDAGQPVDATVSIGVVEVAMIDNQGLDALARADLALYEAKRGGRNQVVVNHLASLTEVLADASDSALPTTLSPPPPHAGV